LFPTWVRIVLGALIGATMAVAIILTKGAAKLLIKTPKPKIEKLNGTKFNSPNLKYH